MLTRRSNSVFASPRLDGAVGVRCVVAASSKLQRPSGDRVKSDAKDAIHPSPVAALGRGLLRWCAHHHQEAVRDLAMPPRTVVVT